jgi:hypothetical protein
LKNYERVLIEVMYIKKIPSNDNMSGIITEIRRSHPEMLNRNIIASSSVISHGNIGSVLSFNGLCQTGDLYGAYIKLDFYGCYIKLSHYSLRGYVGYQFSKSWNVTGITAHGNEVLIGMNTSTEHGFCEPSNWDCPNYDPKLYSVIKNDYTFVSLKWSITKGSLTPYHYFLTSGIELFGTFSTIIPLCKTHNAKMNLFTPITKLIYIIVTT